MVRSVDLQADGGGLGAARPGTAGGAALPSAPTGQRQAVSVPPRQVLPPRATPVASPTENPAVLPAAVRSQPATLPVATLPVARLPANRLPTARSATPPKPVAVPPPSDTHTANWRKWFPGLDNQAQTLREVLATLPAAPPAAIPWIVRLFENPAGLLRLHGAVSLADHDKIHVLLGRGLLDQDEAFVLGFTMGCTKEVSRLESWFFKYALSHLYPHPYRIPPRILVAYDLGIEAGVEFGLRELHLRFSEKMLDLPLGRVRADLGIDTRRLRRYYARERAALPDTPASQRLPMPA